MLPPAFSAPSPDVSFSPGIEPPTFFSSSSSCAHSVQRERCLLTIGKMKYVCSLRGQPTYPRGRVHDWCRAHIAPPSKRRAPIAPASTILTHIPHQPSIIRLLQCLSSKMFENLTPNSIYPERRTYRCVLQGLGRRGLKRPPCPFARPFERSCDRRGRRSFGNIVWRKAAGILA